MKEAEHFFKDTILYCEDATSAMQGADMLVILTEWNEFRSLDLRQVKSMLTTPLVVDLRNIYKRQDMQTHGFHYVSIGRQELLQGEPYIADLNIENEWAA